MRKRRMEMGGQTEFLDAVRELERLAQTNNNHLNMEEIRAYFSDMDLKDEQLDYICRYLESHRIFIENRVSSRQILPTHNSKSTF